MNYTYKHDPDAPALVNYEESLKMDQLRATMGPTSEQLRARALLQLVPGPTKGKVILNSLEEWKTD